MPGIGTPTPLPRAAAPRWTTAAMAAERAERAASAGSTASLPPSMSSSGARQAPIGASGDHASASPTLAPTTIPRLTTPAHTIAAPSASTLVDGASSPPPPPRPTAFSGMLSAAIARTFGVAQSPTKHDPPVVSPPQPARTALPNSDTSTPGASSSRLPAQMTSRDRSPLDASLAGPSDPTATSARQRSVSKRASSAALSAAGSKRAARTATPPLRTRTRSLSRMRESSEVQVANALPVEADGEALPAVADGPQAIADSDRGTSEQVVDGTTPAADTDEPPRPKKKKKKRGWKGWKIEVVDENGVVTLRSPSPEPDPDPDAPKRPRGRPPKQSKDSQAAAPAASKLTSRATSAAEPQEASTSAMAVENGHAAPATADDSTETPDGFTRKSARSSAATKRRRDSSVHSDTPLKRLRTRGSTPVSYAEPPDNLVTEDVSRRATRPRRSEPARLAQANSRTERSSRRTSTVPDAGPSSEGVATPMVVDDPSPMVDGWADSPSTVASALPTEGSKPKGKGKKAAPRGDTAQQTLDGFVNKSSKGDSRAVPSTRTPRLGMGAAYPSPPESDERHERRFQEATPSESSTHDAAPGEVLPDIIDEARFIIREAAKERASNKSAGLLAQQLNRQAEERAERQRKEKEQQRDNKEPQARQDRLEAERTHEPTGREGQLRSREIQDHELTAARDRDSREAPPRERRESRGERPKDTRDQRDSRDPRANGHLPHLSTILPHPPHLPPYPQHPQFYHPGFFPPIHGPPFPGYPIFPPPGHSPVTSDRRMSQHDGSPRAMMTRDGEWVHASIHGLPGQVHVPQIPPMPKPAAPAAAPSRQPHPLPPPPPHVVPPRHGHPGMPVNSPAVGGPVGMAPSNPHPHHDRPSSSRHQQLYTDVMPIPFPTGPPYRPPEPRRPGLHPDFPAIVLAPGGNESALPTNRAEAVFAKAHAKGFDGLDYNLEENAKGFVENVKNNLRTLVGTYFVEPSASRDAFLERIGRDLTDLGWQLTDSADGALYSRGGARTTERRGPGPSSEEQ